MQNFFALQRIVREASEAEDDPNAGRGELSAPAVLAVIKANAYGHGIDPCAAILASAGAEWLGVTDAQEGIEARRVLALAGVAEDEQPRILVMCGTAALPGEAERIVRHRLTPVVWTAQQIAGVAAAAGEAGLSCVEVHIEIDSGMSRQGAAPGAALQALLGAIAAEPVVAVEGVFTHFASTEVAATRQTPTETSAQQQRFESALAQVAASGAKPRWIHAGNSSYIDNGECADSPLRWLRLLADRFSARPMVRSGLALYGYLLPIENASSESLAEPLVRQHVRPVMTWKTRILSVAEVLPGAGIGYNGTFVAERPMRLALLPAGYADGLRRELSSSNMKGGGWVMLRGQRAPVTGRISMNLTSVDVSEIRGVAEGDEVVLLGEGITADNHASLAGTIAYDILCGVRTSA
jgi:alanine racemase